ncbi:hypothetical protein F52700_8012 [Fusarium sp. NRRL 52700]|nr:hypothetical protein F52700_8012 [Fusarium sp. NRRL 52700]
MAEAFGIAGSAFGTISLGIQLFTEISNYLDSVEGRDEDLERAKNYALDFHSSLIALETLASTTGISDPDLERLINQGQANCVSAINNLSKMVAKLKGQDPIPNSRSSKARALYVKLKYPFKKQNLENLEKQLFHTVSVLKFALTILQLRLRWCFDNRRASITDVDQSGNSIVDYTASTFYASSSGNIYIDDIPVRVFCQDCKSPFFDSSLWENFDLVKHFPGISNYLEYGQLSRYPSSINEINHLGQTPVHIAVQTQNATILSVLVNHAVPKVLNAKDNNGHYAIDHAIDALCYAEKSGKDSTSKVCNGCEVLNVLLRSESAIFTDSVRKAMQMPWGHDIPTCIEGQKNIIRSLAARRKELKTLAQRELTPEERQNLKFCEPGILDQNAAQTQRFLEANKCHVPTHLKVYDNDESPEDSESIFLLIFHGDLAESALQSGFFMPMTLFNDVFRSLAEWLNRLQYRPRHQDFLFASYICWLVDQGGDLHSTIPTLWGHTTAAHYFMTYLGNADDFEVSGPLSTADRHEIEEEDSSQLELFEQLVKEFKMERGNYVDLLSFAQEYWAPRMEAVRQEMDSYVLTETQRQSAEAVGVVWECYGPQLPLCGDDLTTDTENEEEAKHCVEKASS